MPVGASTGRHRYTDSLPLSVGSTDGRLACAPRLPHVSRSVHVLRVLRSLVLTQLHLRCATLSLTCSHDDLEQQVQRYATSSRCLLDFATGADDRSLSMEQGRCGLLFARPFFRAEHAGHASKYRWFRLHSHLVAIPPPAPTFIILTQSAAPSWLRPVLRPQSILHTVTQCTRVLRSQDVFNCGTLGTRHLFYIVSQRRADAASPSQRRTRRHASRRRSLSLWNVSILGWCSFTRYVISSAPGLADIALTALFSPVPRPLATRSRTGLPARVTHTTRPASTRSRALRLVQDAA